MSWCSVPVVGAACDVVGEQAQNAVQQFLDWCTAGLGKVTALITSGWLEVPTPGVEPLPGTGMAAGRSANGATTTAAWLQEHTLWLSSWVSAACLVVAGARMAYRLRGLQDLRVIVQSLVTLVLVNGCVVSGTHVLVQVGDGYSTWIIQQSLGGDAGRKLGTVVAGIGSLTTAMGGPAVPLILVVVALVSSLLNLVVGYFRAAILVVLAGTVGIPAGSALTDTGRRWLARWLGWLLAFLCLKPAAATLYAASYRLIGSAAGAQPDVGSTIAGLALLSGTVVVLPALLRLFQPAGLALAGGSGAAGAGSARGGEPSGARAPSGSAAAPAQGSGSGGGPSGAAAGGRTGLTSALPSGVSGGGASGGGLSAGSGTSGASGGAGPGAAAAAAGHRPGAGAGAAAGGAGSGTAGGGGAAVAGGRAGAAGGPVGAASGAVAGAVVQAGQRARQQLVDGLREGAQGLDRELGDGPSGS
ncbi:hypothetical protein LO771_27925 [Streptacidiphilus sp. ASG 303]|uniref:hypothetical protein n=1 Tax=Streptacidiphilus sp. ASG 303 TaxID=2896847 RepID=UPI001E4C109F|nr:hypothetical protein [Streptacidiphilus sp. ASG 303]MCD0486107.1 hypothetical protein [Streptacidiphilus sp. ASG 303]